MKKAFSYVRFSTPEQAKGTSRDRQVRGARAYSESQGWQLTEIHDSGVSAFRGANRTKGALSKFLALVENGSIEKGSVLIVENLDRLSREQVLDAFTLFSSILAKKIEIVTLADSRHFTYETVNSNPGELMMSLMVMTRAHEESAIKSERLSKAWVAKRRNISEKKLTARCPAWLRLSRDRTSFEVIEERSQIIQRIFRDSVAGFGAAKIATCLNEEGVQPWGRGDGWQSSYLKKILINEAVIGTFQPHKKVDGRRLPEGEPIKNYFPSIIDETVFFHAQKARQDRRHFGGRRGKVFSNLLTGLIKCGACKRPMHFVNKGASPKGGQYLACSGAIRGLCDFRTHHPYAALETSILSGVSELDLSQIITGKNETAEQKGVVAALDSRFKDIRRRRQNLLEAFADDPDPDTRELISRLALELKEVKTELSDARRRLRELDAGLHNASRRISEVDQLKERIAECEENQLYALRAALNEQLKQIIRSIDFDPSGTIFIALKDSLKTYMLFDDRFMEYGEDDFLTLMAALNEPEPDMDLPVPKILL